MNIINMRSKKAKGSVLDGIEGIGEVRKKLLLKEFKSIKPSEVQAMKSSLRCCPKIPRERYETSGRRTRKSETV